MVRRIKAHRYKLTWRLGFILIICTIKSVAQSGRVIKISDGDTFTILDSNHVQYKVRLSGIDCPEKKQAFGERAKQFTADKVFGKHVKLVGGKTDRYGRVLALVVAGKDTLNYDLLRNGYAWHYKQYDKSRYLQAMEDSAREKKVGLWVDNAPVAPWVFRKESKTK